MNDLKYNILKAMCNELGEDIESVLEDAVKWREARHRSPVITGQSAESAERIKKAIKQLKETANHPLA